MRFIYRKIAETLELLAVFGLLVIPPLFSRLEGPLFSKPTDGLESARFVAGIIALALYEEALFRAYLPARIRAWANGILPRLVSPLAEGLPLACFALGHRYLGYANVLVALAAGFALRALYLAVKKKTGSVLAALAGTGALHAAWNLAAYLLLFRSS